MYTRGSGSHLGVIRSWIQRKFQNGEQVTWGSTDVLEPFISLNVFTLENLACNIRDAVVQDFKIKDSDHDYKFLIIRTKGHFSRYVDTSEEAWNFLFNPEGNVSIYYNETNKDGSHKSLLERKCLFYGTVEECQKWLRENKLEDIKE